MTLYGSRTYLCDFWAAGVEQTDLNPSIRIRR